MSTTERQVIAALNRSVLPTIQLVRYPPYEPPVTPSRSGSARPSSIAWSTPAITSAIGPSPQSPRLARLNASP